MTSTPTNLARVPDPEVPARATRRTYTAHYKAQILAEYDSLDAAGRGVLLRRHGLYTSADRGCGVRPTRAGLQSPARLRRVC